MSDNYVMTWFMGERLMGDHGIEVPLDRLRWVNDGESFYAGDRELKAVQPRSGDSRQPDRLCDRVTPAPFR